MAQRNRGRRIIRQKPDRKANRVIFIRSLILMGVFGCLAFLPLFVKLWQLQITDHDYYQELAVKQQTRDSTVTANRGTIYDSNGTVLAMSATVYNIQLSPNDLRETQETYREKVEKAQESGGSLPDYPEPTNEFIASNLAAILDLDEADILRRLEKDSQYEMIKWRVDTEESDAVQEFITENHLSHGIYLMPTSKRYYPKNSLAAQVIGWVNPNMDNVGAYGLEAQFEDELSGQTGRIVTAKDGNGTELLYRFEDYYDAMDGNDLTLTLDATIQSFCESVVQEGVEQFEVQNGAFCLVMDPNTGAILAWANSPTYDLNDPWEISDPVLLQYIEDVKSGAYTEEEAYQKALAEGCTQEEAYDKAVDAAVGNAQLSQWRNKAINDTYEPGSTFKSMVLAAALEEGVVTESDHFYCSGSVMVEGYGSPIKCSNRSGHKDQDLATAVANSCNPAFIEIGQRLGAEKFYDYLEDFGFLGPTNIDVQGESASGGQIIWSRESFTNVDLAVASFGQRFNVTPLQLITAASAVINGGHLMQPYVVSQISDSDGNVLQHTDSGKGSGRGHRQERRRRGLPHRRQDRLLRDHRDRPHHRVLPGLRPRRRSPGGGSAGLRQSQTRLSRGQRHLRRLVHRRRQHGRPEGGRAAGRYSGLSGGGEVLFRHRRRAGARRHRHDGGSGHRGPQAEQPDPAHRGRGGHHHRSDPRQRGLHPGRQPGGGLPGGGCAHRSGAGAQCDRPHRRAGPGQAGGGGPVSAGQWSLPVRGQCGVL